MSGGSPSRARRRPLLPLLLSLMLALGIVLGIPVRAAADGPTTFANATSIAIPPVGAPGSEGQAAPYPSNIVVSGMSGAVTEVTATLRNLTHPSVSDVDILLVAPTGDNLVLLSDLGDPVDPGDPDQLVDASDDTITFDDDADSRLPSQFNLPSGSFLPTNTGSGDTFPGAAPTPSTDTRLADAFTGIDPTGTWQLFIVDDNDGERGDLAGGWSLTITTEVASEATLTTVASSDARSFTGDPVTFTAIVTTADGTPVTGGTVQFRDGVTNLGSPVNVSGSGIAELPGITLTEGDHSIRGFFGGVTGFLGSASDPVAQRVDNRTVVSDNTFCNPGRIATPAGVGASTPYPSNIFVTGLPGQVSKVTAQLRGLTHDEPTDLDVMLTGPEAAGRKLVLLSDAGGTNNSDAPSVDNQTISFDDSAPTGVTIPLVSGTYQPTDNDPDDAVDSFPAPAPATGTATALTTFNGSDANGTWSLWVVDDAASESGSFSGGWCLTIEAQVETETALVAVPTSSIFNQSVDFRATVTAGDEPVDEGSVRFSEGATVLGTVDLTADGTAVFPTATLAVGTHTITATYLGADGFGESADDLPYVVDKRPTVTVVSSSANPSDVDEAVTFTATVTDAGAPVTAGTVQFSIDGAPVGDPMAPNAESQATYEATGLADGTYEVRATYSGTATLGTSVGDLIPDQQVDLLEPTGLLTADPGAAQVNQAVTFTATFTVDGAPATPGAVDFTDGATTLCAAVAVDGNGTATCPTAFTTAGTHQIVATFAKTDTYAVGTATLGYAVELIPTETTLATSGSPSDVGEEVGFTAAVTSNGVPVSSGLVQFSDDDTALGAPVPVSANGEARYPTVALAAGTHPITATFVGTSEFAASLPSNVVNQVVRKRASTLALSSSSNPSDLGEPIIFAAEVTQSAGGAAVSSGSVTFRVGGRAPVVVPVGSSGVATYPTPVSDLEPGVTEVSAVFGGDDTYLESAEALLNQGVRPVADAGGPYTVAEGASLALAGSSPTDGVTYGWDLNGDDDFTDAAGATPTLTWAQLEALDIDDAVVPPVSRTVRLRVTIQGVDSVADSSALYVTNTAPASVLTGGLSATVGVPFTIKVGADDPSSADMAALFTYTVDWGDGSPVFTVDGPADPPVTHTYATAGEFEATFTATDKDGGTGPGTTVTVLVAAAPTASPTPHPNPTTGDPYDWDDDYDDSDDSGSSLASTGSVVGLGTILAGILLLGAGGAVLIASRRRAGRREG